MTDEVYVWDKFVRLFHWSLVVLFTISYLTGEEESSLHVYSGYAIVLLVLARIGWGVLGSKHARFSDFVCGPAKVMAYSKSVSSGNPKHYLGHNPLGGLMVLALLASLLTVTFSGMKLYAVEEGRGPLADAGHGVLVATAYASDDEYGEHEGNEEIWEEIHEAAVNVALVLVFLHIGGVVLSSWVHRESLVKAMLTGYKQRR